MFINKNKGITLLELLITLILIGILVVIATPYFSHLFAKLEAKKTASSLRTVVSYAKHNAYLKRDRLVICGSVDGISCNKAAWSNSLLVFKDNKNKNRLRESNEEIVQRIDLNLKHGQLSWKGAGDQNTIFHADSGLPRGGNGTFKYCSHHPNNHFNLILSDMGHLRQEKLKTCS